MRNYLGYFCVGVLLARLFVMTVLNKPEMVHR